MAGPGDQFRWEYVLQKCALWPVSQWYPKYGENCDENAMNHDSRSPAGARKVLSACSNALFTCYSDHWVRKVV